MRIAATGLALLALSTFAACEKPSGTDVAPAVEQAAVAKQPAIGPEGRGDQVQIDPVTGFKMSGDWELVRAHCTGCHSSKLVTQQRGTAQQWLAMIRWMQKKQNLWQFDPDTENRIVTYLSENYPPDEARRRAAIPPELMPPNPYSNLNVN